MKCSLIKVWRSHVNDTSYGVKPRVESIEILVYLQWKLIVFIPGLHFPSMRLLHIIDLKTSISLKVLDYIVTSPWKCAYKFWILVGYMHFDFDIKRGKLSIIRTLPHISQNDTTWKIPLIRYKLWGISVIYLRMLNKLCVVLN